MLLINDFKSSFKTPKVRETIKKILMLSEDVDYCYIANKHGFFLDELDNELMYNGIHRNNAHSVILSLRRTV